MRISSSSYVGSAVCSRTQNCVIIGDTTPSHDHSLLIFSMLIPFPRGRTLLPLSKTKLSGTFLQRLEDLSHLPRLNYSQYCHYPRQTRALLSIRPQYAAAIFQRE